MPYPSAPEQPERRRLLASLAAVSAVACLPQAARAGAQREETLSDDVTSVMRHSVNNVNPPRLVFENPYNAPRWLNDMSLRLARFVPDPLERRRLLINIQYETTRAGQ